MISDHPRHWLAAAIVAIPMSLHAQLGNRPIEVVSPPGESLTVTVDNLPATQTVDGEVNVGNFPATQTVDGQVDVGNFPATQTVDGEVTVANFPATQVVDGQVDVGNFPATQDVSGSVSVSNEVATFPASGYGHLGVPLADHRRYTQTLSPILSEFGISLFSQRTPIGGGRDPNLATGECLVLLDIEVVYRTLELLGPSTITPNPNALAYVEIGLANRERSAFRRFSTLVGVSDDQGYGTFYRSFASGLFLAVFNTAPEVDEIALNTVATGASDEFYSNVISAEATGYVTDCP